MSFKLEVLGEKKTTAVFSESQFECFEEAVMSLCSYLSKNDFNFKIIGGELNWPVDVSVDLSTITPQIYDVVIHLILHEKFTLEFYEQGIERRVEFNPTIENGTTHFIVKYYNFITNSEVGSSDIVRQKDLIDNFFTFLCFIDNLFMSLSPDYYSNNEFREKRIILDKLKRSRGQIKGSECLIYHYTT